VNLAHWLANYLNQPPYQNTEDSLTKIRQRLEHTEENLQYSMHIENVLDMQCERSYVSHICILLQIKFPAARELENQLQSGKFFWDTKYSTCKLIDTVPSPTITRNTYHSLGTEWHLTSIEELWSLWQLSAIIVMTTVIITMPLLSNNLFVVDQWQCFSGYLDISDAAKEVGDWCFVDVAMKEVSSDGNMANTLPRRAHL